MALNIETNRLRTFDNWNVPFIDKHRLALLGFYYYGPRDLVKCYFCNVEVGMWEEGDDILADHMKWSSSCSFICRRHTNNIPIDENLLNQTLPPGSQARELVEWPAEDVYGISGGLVAELPILKRPPEFAVEAKRIASYADWPKTLEQRPEQLSDAGFYYTGRGDRVCCFSCGGGLKDWEHGDDPWEQHGMWYGKCKYLLLMKGKEFVDQMNKKRAQVTPGTSSSQTQMGEENRVAELEEDTKLCKICYNHKHDTIFVPCGHIIACAKCASAVSKCPACRQPFDNIFRIYYS